MKKIELIVMKLRNFKGVQAFELRADGESVEVYGSNAAGKTTLFDAFTWALFGKDSQDRKDFQIKTLDSDNQEIHHLEHEVELQLRVDGKFIVLRRLFHENWSKISGGAEQVFKNNSTKFYVDDVPMNEKTYKAFIDTILSEKDFKLLTSTTYFNEVLKWEERRKVLIELGGNITDEEVIVVNPSLKELPALLGDKTIEQKKAQNTERRKSLKEKIAEIPNRIDELRRLVPEVLTDAVKEREESERLQQVINALNEQKAKIESGAAIWDSERREITATNEVKDFERRFGTAEKEAVQQAEVAVQVTDGNIQITQSKVRQVENDIAMKDQMIVHAQQMVVDAQNARAELLKQHKTLKATVYVEPDISDCCPTCKQDLPKEQVEITRQTASENWNLQRTSGLEAIKQQGLAQAERIIELQTKVQLLQRERQQIIDNNLAIAQKEVAAHEKDREKALKKLEAAKLAVSDIHLNADYQTLLAKLDTAKQELAQLREHAKEATTGIDEAINKLKVEKAIVDKHVAEMANVTNTQRRINELEEEQETLVTQLEQVEKIDYLMNEFERKKAALLNERINDKFEHVKFKLFHDQMNGGLKEVCETLYANERGQLVSYQNGLNTAAKMDAGLDIIAALQQHLGISSVIFLDNRESVTQISAIDAQLISLFVSAEDKQLRVERVGKVQDAEGEQVTLFGEVV